MDVPDLAIGPRRWIAYVMRTRFALLIEVALERIAALRAAKAVCLGDGFAPRLPCEGAENGYNKDNSCFHNLPNYSCSAALSQVGLGYGNVLGTDKLAVAQLITGDVFFSQVQGIVISYYIERELVRLRGIGVFVAEGKVQQFVDGRRRSDGKVAVSGSPSTGVTTGSDQFIVV